MESINRFVLDRHTKKLYKAHIMEKPSDKPTAIFIRKARQRLRVTQDVLGSQLGIPRYNIAKYENGTTVPPGDIIIKIFELLGNATPKKQ